MYNLPPTGSNSRDYYLGNQPPPYQRSFYDGPPTPYMGQHPFGVRSVEDQFSRFPGRPTWSGDTSTDSYPRIPAPPRLGSTPSPLWRGKRSMFPTTQKAGPPRKVNILYCEICKVSCVGPKALEDHNRGQRHQKRLAKGDTPSSTPSESPKVKAPEKTGVQSGPGPFHCDLCEVSTTGPDSYAAHLAGKAHQRALKLHRDLGKPVPEEPVLPTPPRPANKTNGSTRDSEQADHPVPKEAVGAEYVEVIAVAGNKATYYRCKLCDCQFTNREGRDLHLLGRRHKLQYKQKVDPSFVLNPVPRGVQGGPLSEIPPMPDPNRLPWATFLSAAHRSRPMPPGRDPSIALGNRYLTLKHSQIVPTDLEARAIKTVVPICEHALKEISDGLLAGRYDPDTTNQDEASVQENSDEHRMLRGVVRVGPLGKSLLLRGDHEARLVLVCAEWPTVKLLEFLKTELETQLVSIDSGFTYGIVSNPSVGTLTVVATKLNATEPWPVITVYVQVTSPVVLEQGKASNKINASGAVRADGCSALDDSTAPLRTAPEQEKEQPGNKATLDRGRRLFARGLERIAENQCLDALDAIDQTKWFQAAITKRPLGAVSRLLLDFMRANEIWLELDEFAILAFLDRLLTFDMQALCRSVGPYNAPPGPLLPFPSPPHLASAFPTIQPITLFRRFFEAISSGLLLQLDSSETAEKSKFFAFGLLADASLEVREAVTVSAQQCLRQIAFNQLDKVLRLEPSTEEQFMDMNASGDFTDHYPVTVVPTGGNDDLDSSNKGDEYPNDSHDGRRSPVGQKPSNSVTEGY